MESWRRHSLWKCTPRYSPGEMQRSSVKMSSEPSILTEVVQLTSRAHAGAPCHLSWNTRGETSLGIQDVRCRWQWGNWFPWNETVSLHDFDIYFWKYAAHCWLWHTIILWLTIFGFILFVLFLDINHFVILYSFDHSSPQKCWRNIQHTNSKWWKICQCFI